MFPFYGFIVSYFFCHLNCSLSRIHRAVSIYRSIIASRQKLCYNNHDSTKRIKVMADKPRKKTLCLFYILILFFINVISGASSASEITGSVCAGNEYYVNHMVSTTLTSMDKRLPARECMSTRDSEGPETLSATGSQRVRPLSRSVRHAAIDLFSCNSTAGLYALSGQLHRHTISVHSLCGIIITDYIHHQDGQKS